MAKETNVKKAPDNAKSAPRGVDVLILGGGPAGLTAALYAARAGAKVLVAENLACGGQVNLTPEILNFPGFMEIGGAELGEKIREQAEHAGAEIIYDEVQRLNLGKNSVEFGGVVVGFRSLIIATGGRARGLNVEREDDFVGCGVHYCGLCDGDFYRGKTLIVAGGGNHAVEEAIYLSKIASKVTIVTGRAKLNAQEALVKQLGEIEVIYNAKIKGLVGEKKITGVILTNGQSLSCDGIFVAQGRIPNSELFKGQIALDDEGWVIVDGDMRTSVPNVFAAGDICAKKIKQVITACADGAIAGIMSYKNL
jgi:thioredoxin reductase (NADPH)